MIEQVSCFRILTSHITNLRHCPLRWEAKRQQCIGHYSDRLTEESNKVELHATPYKYCPLEIDDSQIRLLKPIRRWTAYSKTNLLHFKVKVGRMNQKRDYYAISYAWGDEPGTAKVVLDGKVCIITASAERALRGLLKALHKANIPSSTYIWIDSISLNQQSLEEKTVHVAKMGEIYSNARCVLLWLGEDDGTTEKAVEITKGLSDQALTYTSGEAELESNGKLPGTEMSKLPYLGVPLPPYDLSILESLICSKPFTRLWCAQEIVLARKLAVFRGEYYVSWEQFILALTWLQHRMYAEDWEAFHDIRQVASCIQNIMGFSKYRWAPERRTLRFLDETLGLTCTLQATNPWDRVYGLTGLLLPDDTGDQEGDLPPFAVDYQKPLPDVYAEAFLLALGHAQCPFIFTYAQSRLVLEDESTIDWPSWVPKFHLCSSQLWLRFAPSTFASTPDEHSIKIHPQDNKILLTPGMIVDEVETIYPPPLNKSEYDNSALRPDRYPDAFKHFTYLWSDNFATENKVTWNEASVRSLFFAMINDASSGSALELPEMVNFMVGNFCLFLRQVRAFCTGLVSRSLTEAVEACTYEGDLEIEGLQVATLDAMMFPLIITKGGEFGMAARHVMRGDKICLIEGTTQTYLMREHGEHWKLKGTCHFPGITDPEYIQELRDSGRYDKENRVFDIN